MTKDRREYFESFLKEAWLLDNGELIHGVVSERVFYPDNDSHCGFRSRTVRAKDRNRILFYDRNKAKATGARFVHYIPLVQKRRNR